MIAKGTTHNNGAKLGQYMITGKKGERAELFQLRGFAENDIVDAFRSIHILADATHCHKPFFHTQVRNPEGEALTHEQWEHVADRIEIKLGYSRQPRAIAFHTDEKTGHEHMHIAWSRIDDEKMTAKPLPFFKLRLKEVCRELEEELDITRVSSERPSPEMAPTRDEDKQGRRLGVDVREVRAAIRFAWDQADSGRAFAAALEDQGLKLCQGDRRDYVVLDPEGGLHALGKRVLGTTAAETRTRMADLDHGALPTVEQARNLVVQEHEREADKQDNRGHEPEAAVAAPTANAPQNQQKDLNRTAADIRLAYSLSESAESFATALGERGLHLAAITKGDAEASRIYHYYVEMEGRYEPIYSEGEIVVVNDRCQVYRLTEQTTGEKRGEVEKFLGPLDRSALHSLEETQESIAAQQELYDIERQAFIAVTRAQLLDRQHPAPPNLGECGPDLDGVARSTEKLMGLAFDIGEKLTEPAIEGMAASFESLFDATPQPAPQPKSCHEHDSPPHSGPIDHWRYLSDEKYRKEILKREGDEQARQQRIRDELERTGQSRDRER